MTSSPMSREAFLQSALPLAQTEQWDVLQTRCEERLRDVGDDADVLYVKGVAAFAGNDLATAAACAARALESRTQFAECSDLVALTHGLAGDINTGLYYAKLAVTLPAREDLRAFHPAGFPTFAEVLKGAEEDRLVNRAKIAMGMGNLDLADNFLRQHLHFFPDDETAMLLVAVCLSIRGDHFGATDWLRGTLHRRPASANLLSALANELSNTGAFAEARVAHRRAAGQAPDDAIVHARQVYDLTDDPSASADDVLRRARAWGERFAAHAAEDIAEPAGLPAPLSIGVLLSDLPGTRAGTFLAEILARCNPDECRVVGYGYGTLTDAGNSDFQHAVAEWYDLSDLDAETIGDMCRAESLDVIIDTSGFASPLSLAALGGRCAPRQVLWRHAPYGTGMAAIDAQFTDATLEAAVGPKPAGRLVPLERGTVLAALPAADMPTFETGERSQIVFGADVSLRQLTAETAAWWADAVLAVPGSVLLLRDNRLSAPKAVDRLTTLFGNCGVAHRIDLVAAEDGAQFWAQVDVALMPTRAAIPQRALNTLWGGLPVLAPALPERGNRDLASLFSHAGVGELVAGSPAEFARLAKEWAVDAERRRSFRDTIRARLSASPVFDPEARAQDLWQACRQLFT